jgi:transporter family-2 protein
MNLSGVFLALAAAGGLGLAVQAPTNALLGRSIGSPMAAALVSFVVGAVALAAVVALSGWRPAPGAWRDAPWAAWLGGLYGAFFVAVAAYGAPRIGAGALLTAAIAGQLAGAVALDQLGALGLPRHPASLTRLAGVALVMGGALLVRLG